MSKTVINVSAVMSSSSKIIVAKNNINSVKNSFAQTKSAIDSKIKNRSNISSRLNSTYARLSNIDSKIARIHSMVQTGADKYQETEAKIESWKRDIRNNVKVGSTVVSSGSWADYFKNAIDGLNNIASSDNKNEQELREKTLKTESGVLKALSKLLKDKDKSNDLAFSSSLVSYFSGLYTFYTMPSSDGGDLLSATLRLTKSSTSMWNGTYKYLEKNLTTMQAAKFGKKYQGKVAVVSLIGSTLGFTADSINTFKTFMDSDADKAKRVDSILKSSHSGLDVAQSAVNLKYGKKVLTRGVTAKYQWGVAGKAKLDNATACISVLGVTVDSAKGGYDKYAQVTSDGHLDMKDMGEIGISTSEHGLTSVINKATFGLSDAFGLSDSADVISDKIVNLADNAGANFVPNHKYSSAYVKNAQVLMDCANDESQNVFKRVGAATLAGSGMIVNVALDGVSDGLCWMGGQISSGWNSLKSVF